MEDNEFDWENYQEMVATLGQRDGKPMSMSQGLTMGALGLAGEVGEVSEHIKKYLFHNKVLNLRDLKLELGDVLWYLTFLSGVCGYSLAQIAQGNMAKLQDRHHFTEASEAKFDSSYQSESK